MKRRLLGLAALGMLVTVAIAWVVFPHGTTDLDEVSYQTQANVMRHGHLTLAAATRVPHFLPFLSGVRGDRVVFKYQPEWPALIVASDAVFGSSLPLRMLCTAAAILAVAWLGWELTREQVVALLAAALALASPFMWVQGASLLGYQLSFVLGTGAAAALLRAGRLRRSSAWFVAGTIVGLALLHRPFDAVLAVAPVVAYLMWTLRAPRPRRNEVGAALVGVVPFALVLLAYNAAVMGSALRLPYGVTGPQDTFLFGWRASSVPGAAGHAVEIHYTIGRAISTLGHDLALMPRFVALAPLVLAFAGAAVWKWRADPRSWLLVGMVVVVLVAYFFWWATANAELFGIDRGLGPFYDYAALAPLCVLGAWGMTTVKVPARVLVPLGVVALIWAVGASRNVLTYARQQGRDRSAAVRIVEPSSPRATLVLFPPEYSGDPYLRFVSDDHLDGRRLMALDVASRRLELVDRYPDRAVFLVRDLHPFGDVFGRTTRDRVPLSVVRGRGVTIRLHAKVSGAGAGSPYLRIGDGRPMLSRGGRGRVDAAWTVDAAQLDPTRTTTVAVGVTVGAAGKPAPHAMTGERFECRFETRVVSGMLEMLTPCDGWNHYEFPNGTAADSNEDLGSVLDTRISPVP